MRDSLCVNHHACILALGINANVEPNAESSLNNVFNAKIAVIFQIND